MGKLTEIEIAPGIYTIDSDRGAEGRWKDGNHVRWWQNLVQKIGGWQRITSSNTFSGIARGIADWQALNLEKYRGLGTHLKLYAWGGGTFADITPIRESGTLGADPFTTTNGSAVVSVADTGHANLAGDYVHFSGASAVGGITINGEYTVTAVSSANAYTITHSAAATSGATGGGAAVAYEYEIHVGAEDSEAGLGWGAGTFGSSTWGTARTTSDFLFMARIWSLDTWGEDLIACPRGGGIYVWDSSVGLSSNRATVISGAPTTCRAIFVSVENRHLVALGAHDGSVDNPLLVRWCSAEDYTAWTASATNTAGDKQLDHGNEIYCGVKTKGETAIFTDTALVSMIFDGPPYQFRFDYRGLNGGIAGPNAAKEFNGRVFWLADQNFMVYEPGSAPRILDCDVLNHVFDDINWTQRAKVFAGANRRFAEVWWLYCTEDSDECDVYVLYNTKENHWSYGTLVRTLLVGDSDTFADPYAAGTDGRLYTHEIGVNDDGAALSVSLESGDVDLGEGEYLMQIKKLVPDFVTLTGSVSMTFTGKKYPQSSETTTNGPHTVSSSTEFINPRIRARQLSISLSATAIGDDFRMAPFRVELVPHGKR